jgi:hypothetical protein
MIATELRRVARVALADKRPNAGEDLANVGTLRFA